MIIFLDVAQNTVSLPKMPGGKNIPGGHGNGPNLPPKAGPNGGACGVVGGCGGDTKCFIAGTPVAIPLDVELPLFEPQLAGLFPYSARLEDEHPLPHHEQSWAVWLSENRRTAGLVAAAVIALIAYYPKADKRTNKLIAGKVN